MFRAFASTAARASAGAAARRSLSTTAQVQGRWAATREFHSTFFDSLDFRNTGGDLAGHAGEIDSRHWLIFWRLSLRIERMGGTLVGGADGRGRPNVDAEICPFAMRPEIDIGSFGKKQETIKLFDGKRSLNHLLHPFFVFFRSPHYWETLPLRLIFCDIVSCRRCHSPQSNYLVRFHSNRYTSLSMTRAHLTAPFYLLFALFSQARPPRLFSTRRRRRRPRSLAAVDTSLNPRLEPMAETPNLRMMVFIQSNRRGWTCESPFLLSFFLLFRTPLFLYIYFWGSRLGLV